MNPSTRIVVNWGHLALLAVIATVIAAYLIDARATSLKSNNLLFIQPACVVGLILVAVVVVTQGFRRVPAAAETPGAETSETKAPAAQSMSELGKVGALMAVFVALALSMGTIGFDVATFGFLVIALRICGEKSWLLNLGYSAAFTLLLIYGYGAIIPFPFPLTVL